MLGYLLRESGRLQFHFYVNKYSKGNPEENI